MDYVKCQTWIRKISIHFSLKKFSENFSPSIKKRWFFLCTELSVRNTRIVSRMISVVFPIRIVTDVKNYEKLVTFDWKWPKKNSPFTDENVVTNVFSTWSSEVDKSSMKGKRRKKGSIIFQLFCTRNSFEISLIYQPWWSLFSSSELVMVIRTRDIN